MGENDAIFSYGHIFLSVNIIVTVFCSAGVGRTGTYMALDYLLSEAGNTGEIDIYECVKALRSQRMYSVQTLVRVLCNTLTNDVLINQRQTP